MKKKLLALAALLAVVLGLFAGCAVTADKPAEDSEYEVGQAANAAEAYDTLQFFSCS